MRCALLDSLCFLLIQTCLSGLVDYHLQLNPNWELNGCGKLKVTLASLFFFVGEGGQILSDLITCLAIRAEAIPTLAVVNKNDLVSKHS